MPVAFGQAVQRGARYPKSLGFSSGPWNAVQDAIDPSTAGPALLRTSQNLYPEQTDIGTAWIGRPGFIATGDVLGSSTHLIQGFHEFIKLDGTRYHLLVCEGKLYSYDWGTDSYTDKSSGQPTTSATAQIAMVTFANTVVVSDGVNTPFTWDGASFVSLTAAPVFYGPPWVYYDYLFGIKASERNTLVWSDVNDPTIGYEAGGFNNAWTLGQSSQDPLTAGVGMNELMYVFRSRSITSILGTPGPDFSTQGTREGVSETVGTISPFAVVVFERTVYFLDADARPQRVVVGAGVDANPPAWAGCIVTSAMIPRTYLSTAVGAYDQQTQIVVFGVPGLTETSPTFCLTMIAGTGTFGGTWTGFPMNAMGIWNDDNGEPRLMHGATDGIGYAHGVTGDGTYNDNLLSGAVPVDHVLEISPVGYDAKIEKQWDRVDLSMRLTTSVTSVNVSVNTPAGQGTAQPLSFAGGLSYWDDAVWDAAVWSGAESETHGAVGTNEYGRWATVRFEHSVLDETIGFIEMALEAFALGSYPATP